MYIYLCINFVFIEMKNTKFLNTSRNATNSLSFTRYGTKSGAGKRESVKI